MFLLEVKLSWLRTEIRCLTLVLQKTMQNLKKIIGLIYFRI